MTDYRRMRQLLAQRHDQSGRCGETLFYEYCPGRFPGLQTRRRENTPTTDQSSAEVNVGVNGRSPGRDKGYIN
jgi:hypothetical protein